MKELNRNQLLKVKGGDINPPDPPLPPLPK